MRMKVLALTLLASACAPPETREPLPPKRVVDTDNHSQRIADKLAWALGEQPGRPGSFLGGFVVGAPAQGSEDLVARTNRPRPDGGQDVTLTIYRNAERIQGMWLKATDADACVAAETRIKQKWPDGAAFAATPQPNVPAGEPWIVWASDDGTRAVWHRSTTGCELHFEQWQKNAKAWLEQPNGVVELALLDAPTAIARLGKRTTEGHLDWSDPGIGTGVGNVRCTSTDGEMHLQCTGESDATAIDSIVAWFDTALGAHTTNNDIVEWNSPAPSLRVTLRRWPTLWNLSIEHPAATDDPKRTAACAKAATVLTRDASKDDAKKRSAAINTQCTKSPWPDATLSCLSGRRGDPSKCLDTMIAPLRHALDMLETT